MLLQKKSKLYTSEHVEIGKQSPLKQEWKSFLKSSSLFVRIHVSIVVSLLLLKSFPLMESRGFETIIINREILFY